MNRKGLLDDVRIYNRALSANEVANLARGRYASGNSSTSTFTLGGNLSVARRLVSIAAISTSSSRTLTVTNALQLLRGGGNLTLGSATTTLNGGLTLSGRNAHRRCWNIGRERLSCHVHRLSSRLPEQ